MQAADQTPQELLKIGPFLGTDQTTSLYYVTPQYAYDAANFDPSDNGNSFSLLNGRKKSVLTRPFSPRTTSLGLFYQRPSYTGPYTPYLVGFSTSEMFQEAPIGGSVGALTPPPAWPGQGIPPGGQITGTKARFVQFQGYLYTTTNGAGVNPYGLGTHAPMSNVVPQTKMGDIPLKVSNLSPNMTLWQIAPPLSAPNVAVGGTGLLAGYYYWRVTYSSGSEDIESTPGPIIGATGGPGVMPTALLLNNQEAVLDLTPIYQSSTPPAWFDPQVDTINIYRLGGTSSQWIQVGSVPVTTSSFTDNTADIALTGAALTLHQDPPPNFNSICVHKGRIWGLGYNSSYPWNFTSNNDFVFALPQSSDLWFSDFNQPSSFDCVNQVLPLDRDNAADGGVGLMSVGSVIFALKQKSVWATYGDNAEDFYSIKVLDIGCVQQETIAVGYGYGFWLSNSGVHKTDSQNFTNISNGTQNPGIRAALGKLLSTPGTNFVGWCQNQFYFLFETTTNTGWGYYIPTDTWTSVNFSYAPNVAVADPQEEVSYVLSPNYQVDEWFAQTQDDYGPLIGTWTTGNYDCGAPHLVKEFLYAAVQIPSTDPNSNFDITFWVDGILVCTANLVPHAPTPTPGDNSYFRVSFPQGTQGVNITVQITATQAGSTAIVLDRISIYGQIYETFPPSLSVGDGST